MAFKSIEHENNENYISISYIQLVMTHAGIFGTFGFFTKISSHATFYVEVLYIFFGIIFNLKILFCFKYNLLTYVLDLTNNVISDL